MRDVDTYLSTQKENCSNNDIVETWRQFEEYYQAKLWHQLTHEILVQLKNPAFVKDLSYIGFYENFIADFEHRINPVCLVEIVSPIANSLPTPTAAVEFLERIREVVKASAEATVLCSTYIVEQKLRDRNASGQCNLINEVKELIEKTQVKLDTIEGIGKIHGEFYRLSSTYLREIGDYTRYYREALRYLGCIELRDLSADEQKRLALCLSLAALLGDDVYNFGELLAHPILESLKNSSDTWIVDLLFAFNSGNLTKFKAMQSEWAKQEDLRKNEAKLLQKIQLLSVMELAFARPSNERQLKFEEIRKVSGVALDQVEFLVMKALSLDLIRGFIDEVNSLVCVTWVQPRVLDKSQIHTMACRISAWGLDVSSIANVVQREATEILTH